MAFGLDDAIGAAAGLAGIFGGNQESRYSRAAASATRQQQAILAQVWKAIQGYDPGKETAAAIDFASKQTGNTLENALSSLMQKYKVGGGSVTGDTNFRIVAQRATDDILNPLAQFAADRNSSEFQRKLQAFGVALGAPMGQVAQQYMALDSMNRQDMSGSQQLLANALSALAVKPKAQTPGSGPSAGIEYNNALYNTARQAISPLKGRQNTIYNLF